jgi:hypothetical protein
MIQKDEDYFYCTPPFKPLNPENLLKKLRLYLKECWPAFGYEIELPESSNDDLFVSDYICIKIYFLRCKYKSSFIYLHFSDLQKINRKKLNKLFDEIIKKDWNIHIPYSLYHDKKEEEELVDKTIKSLKARPERWKDEITEYLQNKNNHDNSNS